MHKHSECLTHIHTLFFYCKYAPPHNTNRGSRCRETERRASISSPKTRTSPDGKALVKTAWGWWQQKRSCAYVDVLNRPEGSPAKFGTFSESVENVSTSVLFCVYCNVAPLNGRKAKERWPLPVMAGLVAARLLLEHLRLSSPSLPLSFSSLPPSLAPSLDSSFPFPPNRLFHNKQT